MSPTPRKRPSLPLTPKLSGGVWTIIAIVAMLACYAALLEYSRPHVSGDSLKYSEFVDYAERDRILDAKILDADSYVVGTYRAPDGKLKSYLTPYFRLDTRGPLLGVLIPNQITTTVDQQTSKRFVEPLLLLIPALILVAVFIYFIVSYRRGTGLFGIGSGARRIGPEDIQVTFADVAGQDAAVAELRELSDFLSKPERFAAVGSRMPRGVLLYGPPGCGKTLIARALAGEAGAAFYSITGSDFVEMYVGVGAARVRDLFKQARENAPAIVFIDELDAVAGRRATGAGVVAEGGSEQEQSQALNQLLAEMDGFSPTEGIIVLGASNRPDTLDPALLRPGRFDRTVGLELPDQAGRHEILMLHGRGKPFALSVKLRAIAEKAVGMTGADLASVVNEAGLLAARADRAEITQDDLLEALRRILEAPERQRRLSMGSRSIGQRTLAVDRATFADVAGADSAIEELSEVKEFLGAPDRYAAMGARIPRGYLLSGPPGCGKTLLARAVAGEANASFISASGTEFVQRYVGEGAARVRDLFAEARSLAPAILFIDEIDAVGGKRGSMANDHSERHQTLNQILVELDGFSQRAGVVVMAATNRPDTLDAALVRPGRFDRQVVMDLPDFDARLAILRVHAKGKKIGRDVDLAAVARGTRGMAGADLANVMNEAALLAVRGRVGEISPPVLEEAIDRAWLGTGGRRKMSEEDRLRVAYHEAGHGLVAIALPGGRVVHKLSIIPRGRALGVTYIVEEDERYTHSRSLLIERMAGLLGGRIAEELVFGEPLDGAQSDLATVARLARQMVSAMGMSDVVGAINYASETSEDGRHVHSEDTARIIDAEVRVLVEEAGELARRALVEARTSLDMIAEALMERETLTLEEVEELLGRSGRTSSSH